ncbi:hypothetical protein NEPAR04_2514 [Nematocida parisii]|nr:hypothetical protein NEPAR03_2393 [Nematocida parisii]KAI5131582.1 hypothetical protein NEPAR08_2513 [Nematocida parisii]KAI5145835.1 hypothetical protein NEPAR04_2514 [Nematocida parisii]
MTVELKITNISINYIGLYNYIRVLCIGLQTQEENTPVTDKDQIDNYIKTFYIDGNDSNDEIEKKWLRLKHIDRLTMYGSIFLSSILMVILYLISLKSFHIIEEKSVHALSNLIPTNIHPLLHEYVLSGNFLYTLLQIVSGSYIVMGLIEPVYWILRKSKNIAKHIISSIFLGLFTMASGYTIYLIVMWTVSLILRLVEDYTIIFDIIVYGYLLVTFYGLCLLLYIIYKKKQSNRCIGEYITSILYTILLIMCIAAVIYTYSNNIFEIIECIKNELYMIYF